MSPLPEDKLFDRRAEDCGQSCDSKIYCKFEREFEEMYEYIDLCKQREERREAMWQAIKTQVLGWGIIAIAGYIGATVLEKAIK